MMIKRFVLFALFAIVTPYLCFATQSLNTYSQTDNPPSSGLIGGHPIQFAMPILVIAPDARAGGLGDIGVATSPTTNAQNWNPAKYAFLETQGGASLSYIPWLRNIGASNINLLYLTGYYKFDEKNSIAGALRYFAVGSLQFLTEEGHPLITASPNEFAIDFSYTRLLGDNFAMSLTARYIRSDLSGGYVDHNVRMEAANAVAADVGLYYNKPIYVGRNPSTISFGAAITNVGSKMSYSLTGDEENAYFLPTTLRVGSEWLINMNQDHDIAFNLELSKYLIPSPDSSGKTANVGIFEGMVQSFYDAPGGFKEEMQEIMLGVGIEYTYAKQLMARIGYFYDYKSANRKYLTIGAGINYQMFTLDLAYLIPTVSGFSNPLANTIRISLSVDMGEMFSNRETNMPRKSKNNRGGGFFR